VVPGSIGTNQTICTGNTPAPLTSLGGASGGTGRYTYAWEKSTDNLIWSPIPNATGTEYAPGPLTVTTHYRRLASPAIGNCPPTPTGAVTVTVSPVVTPGTIGADQFICAGLTPAPLTSLVGASGGQDPYTYQWQSSPDNTTWIPITNATGADYAPGPLTTTTYYRRQASSGCAAVASNAVRVEVSPLINVEAGSDKEIVEGGQVELEGRANGNFPVVWTPTRGLSFANGNPLRPLASPDVTTVYKLSAGPPGCGDESRVRVTVLPPVRIPNAFSPNGDGRDDTWEIDRISDFPGNTVTVFNRWGNEVFKITNYNRGNEWSGKISGQPAPVGTYYYVVTLGNGKSYSGPLTVLY
jgi:gliding motility-associated-like protein